VDNTGKEVLAAGAPGDQAWRDKVNFFVKGIEGKVPAGK
jgi:simple sugar transport system substrate-binding protein